MAQSTLLKYNPAYHHSFAFEHAMAHRNLLGGMAPLSNFGVIPYFVDPTPSPQPAYADKWQLNHQQAHYDAFAALPVFYGQTTVGIRPAQMLIDSNLTDQAQLAWWTHANHTEHYVAGETTNPPMTLTYPSW
jgi:hypothetical protein